MSEPTLTVSIEEHEQGFKDLEVEKRSGNKVKIRLHAPSLKVARSLTGEFWPLIESCRGKVGDAPLDEVFFDTQLSQDGQQEAIGCAFILAFGAKWEKKMATTMELKKKEAELLALSENLKTSSDFVPTVTVLPS